MTTAQMGGCYFIKLFDSINFCVIYVDTNIYQKGAKMKDSQSVQKKTEMNKDNNKNNRNDRNLLLGLLNLNIAGLSLVVSVSVGFINRHLSGVQEAIDFQNLLMLKLMMNEGDGEYLPSDTVSYQDAQRLYVQTMQQKNSSLSKSIAYNK